MKLSNTESTRLKTKYGEWAIIMGASSGIGLELATQLAHAGFKLIIHSRHLGKLQEVEKQLKASTSIEIKIVASAVSQTQGIAQIIQASQGLNLGLLIVSAHQRKQDTQKPVPLTGVL